MTDAIDRALCCGATCGRRTDATGPCIAPSYGHAIRQRAEAAGYVVAPAEPTDAMCIAATRRDDREDRRQDPYALYRSIYRAMIATTQPQAEGADG